MIYLTCCASARHVQEVFANVDGLGVMLTPAAGRRLKLLARYRYWAADTGCFRHPDRFKLDQYLNWLGSLGEYRDRCLFATAPDVVGDATVTWEQSKPVLPLLRELGYRAALVAQDGIEQMTIDWDAFDAWFVGGSTTWKLSETAYRLAAEAGRRGKWVHMGRVNSWPRLRAAAVGGYDSADGTTLRYNTQRYVPEILRWVRSFLVQPVMEMRA